MSKNLEYVIMVFLVGLLVILYGWSENGHYQVDVGTGAVIVNTRTGDAWSLGSKSVSRAPANK